MKWLNNDFGTGATWAARPCLGCKDTGGPPVPQVMRPALKRLILFAVTLLCSLAPLPAAAVPTTRPATNPAQSGQFLRFVDDGAGGGKLKAAIVTYRNSAGVTVHLVSALHVAEKAYYDSLNKTFESYDVLLYEMIKAKGAQPPAPGDKPRGGISSFQRFLKNVLALDFQLDDIDYTKKNFVHADLDAEDFFAMEKKRGESIFGIMLRTMMREMERAAEGKGPTTPQPTLLDLLIAMRAPDRPRQLKLLLAHQFDQIEEQMAGLDGPDGSVIITDRNKKCIDTLKKAIADGHKNIGIFYGAGHMADLSKRVEALGFRQTKVEWRVAWDMTATPQPATKP